jgi:hypothetical protein
LNFFPGGGLSFAEAEFLFVVTRIRIARPGFTPVPYAMIERNVLSLRALKPMRV